MNRSGRDSINRQTSSTGYGGSQRSQDVSDDYWEKLFSGTDYYDLYQSIMNSYGVAPPNTFWGALTGQNKTNAYQHEMSKRDELSALAEKMYNEEYNSYANQSELMREAGLNPDLLGVTGGASSEMSPDGVNPNIGAANGLDVIQGAAGIVINAFTLGKGIAEGVMSFKSMKLDNLAKRMTLAVDLASFITPQNALEHDASAQYGEIDMLTSSLFRKRDSRKMSHLLKQIVEHPRFKEGYYTNLNNYGKNRFEYFTTSSGEHWDDDDKVMDVISRGLSDIVALSFKTSKERQISDDIEAIEFNDSFDSALSGSAENSENELQGFKKDITKSMLDMVSDLNKIDSPLAKGITIALQLLLAKYIGM